MKNKKIVGALLLALLVSTGTAQAMREDAATTFADIKDDSEYFEGINWAVEEGVAIGYGDRTWKPDVCVTRAEIVKMSFEAVLGEEIVSKKSFDSPFTDVKPSDWYYQYANQAKELGYVEGYEDGSFKATECVNRAEAMKIAVKMLINNPDLNFSKEPVYCGENLVKDIDGASWYAPYARLLIGNELVGLNHTDIYADKKTKVKKGKGDITFSPSDNMTRKEVAEMLYLVRNSEKYNK